METPTVDTGNRHNDSADQPDTTTSAKLQPIPRAQAIIRWAEAGRPALPQTIIAGDQEPLAAGVAPRSSTIITSSNWQTSD